MTKFSLTILGILLCGLSVTGLNPTIISQPPPGTSSRGTWTFQEVPRIDFRCHHGEGKAVHWRPVKVVEGNALLPTIAISNISNEKVNPIQMNITYDRTHYAKVLQVSCYSSDHGPIHNVTTWRIEQIYQTKNVIINDGSLKVIVKPSQTPVSVTLLCKADGNPPPSYSSWHKKSDHGVSTIRRQPAHLLLVHYENDTHFEYQCRAKNRLNTGWVYSPWVEVSGFNGVQPSQILLTLVALVVVMNRSQSAE